MTHLTNIAWILLGIAMIATCIWGIGWALDDEVAQVKAGTKLPGTTILPIVNHASANQ